ncbi:MAG: zinc ribbon domain-containing protein [Dehalococcoidia bacterium]|nr:zinc ribbon domain-containing protein [Dehalococcoidia bacterium]MDD5493072.1 zinc ribbon domain-containing protein [Dehalococcoidia bacterium]
MPVYEFWCKHCGDKVSLFMKISSYDPDPLCPTCEKKGLTRIFANIAIRTSPDSSLSSSDYYKNPGNIGKHLEKRFKDMNMEVPDQIKQSIEAARGGQLPESLKDISSASADSSYH